MVSIWRMPAIDYSYMRVVVGILQAIMYGSFVLAAPASRFALCL